MSVISIVGLTPPPRYPPITTSWTQARIEEAPADSGPWTVIEPAFALSPVPNALDPQSYDFSTSHATLASGWYRVVWIDAANNTDATLPVFNDTRTDAFRPTVAMIGAKMRARTKVRGGTEIGTFRDTDPPTRPTATEVEGVMDDIMPMIEADLGSVPDSLLPQARTAAIYRIAQEIELSYWPEQNDTDQSVAAQYGRLYAAALTTLGERIEGDTPGQTPCAVSVPVLGLDGRRAVFAFSATLTANSPTVATDDTASLSRNGLIEGPGIPSGAYILSVDSATEFTLNVAPTLTGASVLKFTAT